MTMPARAATLATILALAAALLPAAPAASQPEPLPDDPYVAIDTAAVALGEEERAEMEEQWQMARSWGVGALQKKVPEAREALAARGATAVAFLVEKLDDEYSLARRALETIFAKIGPPTIDTLAERLMVEAEEGDQVRRTVIGILAKIRHQASADALVAFVRAQQSGGGDDVNQFRAIMATSILGDPRAVELIQPFQEHEKEGRRLQYCIVMERFRPQAGFEPLLELLGDEFFSVRYAAQEALVAVGEPAVPGLVELAAETDDVIVGNHAVMALGLIGDRRAWRTLQERLGAESWSARGYAVEALSRIDSARARRLFDRRLAGETHPFVLGKLREAAEAAE
jgi:HEAT repeat protein